MRRPAKRCAKCGWYEFDGWSERMGECEWAKKNNTPFWLPIEHVVKRLHPDTNAKECKEYSEDYFDDPKEYIR